MQTNFSKQTNFTPAANQYANGNRQQIQYALTNNLPTYVSQERYPLLIETIYEWESSVRLFQILQGIRCETNITTLAITPQFQTCHCGNNPLGNIALNDRKINTCCLEIDDQWCAKDFICTYAQWYVNRYTPGRESLETTFEQTFMRGYLQAVNRLHEQLIYKGDTASSDPNLKLCDGLLKILRTDGAPTLSPTGSYLQQLQQIAAAIPENAFERGNVAILVPMDVFRTLNFDFFNGNYYNYRPEATAEFSTARPYVVLPGTNIPVYGVYGLNGTNTAIAGSLNNIFYATDFLNDMEELLMDYDRYHKVYYLNMVLFSGVQVAFPDEILLATLDPVAGAAFANVFNVNIQNNPLIIGTDPKGANGGLLTDATA